MSVKKVDVIRLYLNILSFVLNWRDIILSEPCLQSCVFWSMTPLARSSLTHHSFESISGVAPFDWLALTVDITELS